jgi:Up-Regulated in long-lived daf-2
VKSGDYTNHAYANIKNNTGITLKSITLRHQYSDDPQQIATWSNVAPGTTTPTMQVGYNTGFIRYGDDHWSVEYTLPDDSVWVSPSTLTETLSSGDDGKTKTFTITGSIFYGFVSGQSMQLHLSADPGYNAWAVVVLSNNFPVSVSALLKHKYSSDRTYQHQFAPLPPASSSSADTSFVVYFNTGFIRYGSDYWNLSVKLDIPPYDNAPANAFASFTNGTTDKGCMLESEDNGKIQTFTLDGSGLTLGIGSGPSADQWRTWNGYNTLAFIQVKNDFTPAISTVVLSHQYSGDTVWRQTRGLIPNGGSSPWMVAEYNIGFLRTGLDYWNVWVYLEDGEWYQNHKTDKECMLGAEDAVTPSTFTVSSSTFTLGLTSGSCSDGMDDKGQFAPAAGRDVNRSYDMNAFIGSHNAYANFANGFWYAQQSGSLETQLGQGATTLLLDIWYDGGDIYLKHEDAGILQPFVANQKLSDALAIIRRFLVFQSRDPVTIILEDRVSQQYQNLIKQAFVASQTWDMTFNPDVYDVGQKGWPTLKEFFTMAKPLIVLTSNGNSPDFAYQWKYMSENVYSDPSLDPSTWLDPRKESQPLSALSLCALNHFPTWSVEGFNLTTWIERSQTDNATSLLSSMIDACDTRWGRYPNYINADFWQIPDNGLIGTTVYLNQKLRATPIPVLRFQHGRAILQEIDHSRLLRGNWDRETGWIDQHFGEFCPQPDPDQPGPLVHQLANMVNLALVVSTLREVMPSGESVISGWIGQATRELVRYLLDIEPLVLGALGADSAAFDELLAIPYFLIERASEITFEVTDAVRRRTRETDGSATGDHDRLLLAGLAGHADAETQLGEQLIATRAALAEARTTSRIYDLTHEILYLTHLGSKVTTEPSVSTHLGELPDVMAANADVGAELLACYWITGGDSDAASREAVSRLKAFSEAQPAECQAGRDGECRCPRFKEQIHNRLTLVLGLGSTLAIAGEVLD